MPENRHVIRSNVAKLDATTDEDIARQIAEDPDMAPELIDEWFDRAKIRDGDKPIRPARPPLDFSKKLVSLRLDQDVIEQFQAGGPGWQSRINAALRKHLWGGRG